MSPVKAAGPTTAPAEARAGAVVQVDLRDLLDARPVTTLTAGKVIHWTRGVDGGGKGSGYLTTAAALAVGDKNPKALPDDPLIPASESRPAILLHYSNDDATSNQARVVEVEKELVIPIPKHRYGHLFLAWTSSEGGSPISLELTYADGPAETRNVTIPDYYANVPKNDPRFSYVVRDLAKWTRTGQMREPDHHNIHAFDAVPDAKRELTGVKITRPAGKSYLLLWAVTGVLSEEE